MFDLESRIAAWTSDLSHGPSMTSDDVHELEQHLRDAIADLRNKALSDEEAFTVATLRLGHPAALRSEFDKVRPDRVWCHRFYWMLAGNIALGAFGSLLSGLSSLTGSAATFVGLGGSPAGAVSIVVTAIGWAVLFTLIYRQATSRHATDRFGRMSLMWWIAVVMIIPIGNVLVMLSTAINVSHMDATVLGQYMMWLSFGSIALHIGVVAASVALMFAFRRSAGSAVFATAAGQGCRG